MAFNSITRPTMNMGRLLGLGLALASFSNLSAQEKKVDLEARKRSIPILEKHIEQRADRVEVIKSDLMKLNGRIEKQIEGIVKDLSGLKDSQESKQRVSQIKMTAMKGLGKSIGRYKAKRDAIRQQIKDGKSGIPKEVLERDAKVFDEHIAKRVRQILDLSKSFTQEADVEKYEKVDGDDFYSVGLGWDDEIEQISEEWRQNRRDRVMDHKQRREVLEALNKSIEREQDQVKAFEARLKRKNIGAVDRKLMQAELERHKGLLQVRKDQLKEFNSVSQPETAEATLEDALDFERSISDAAEDLRRDLDDVFVRYSHLNRERQKVAALSKNLEARKKWLKENAGE